MLVESRVLFTAEPSSSFVSSEMGSLGAEAVLNMAGIGNVSGVSEIPLPPAVTTDVGVGSAEDLESFEDLQLFRYYAEGVVLAPISIFGILGKRPRLTLALKDSDLLVPSFQPAYLFCKDLLFT